MSFRRPRLLGSGVLLITLASLGFAARGSAETACPSATRGEFEKICRELARSQNLYYGTQQVEELEKALRDETAPKQIIDLKKSLANEKLRFGQNVESVLLLSEALAARGESQAHARARDFSSDQGAKPQTYWSISRIWEHRAGGKDPLDCIFTAPRGVPWSMISMEMGCCVFRGNPTTRSEGIGPPIPKESDHPFQAEADHWSPFVGRVVGLDRNQWSLCSGMR